jgi:hypothetical protein
MDRSMTKFYRKELPDTPVYINGAPVRFEVLRTEDQTMINELDACIARHMGGIVAITEEEFLVLDQKKTSETSYGSAFKQRQSSQQGPSGLRSRLAAATAELPGLPVDPNALPVSGRPIPQPVQVPSPNKFSGIFIKPSTAKASDVK